MPMMPEIKICGIKDREELEIVSQFPISYIGFIFAENSKRQISPRLAKELKKMLNPQIKAVGVFTNTPIVKVNDIAEYVKLDFIQLHSGETNEDCKKAVKPVWKMVSVKEEGSIKQVCQYPDAAGILLDTYSEKMLGGTGAQFNWDYVKGLSEHYFTILAGGLTPENIELAVKKVRPHVLDMNSGVETEGRKDEKKMKELVRRLRHGIE